MTRILTLSSLYPNTEQPARGIFVEARLRQLIAISGIEASVVAPIPWFPFRNRRFGEYAEFARVLKKESRHGLAITHPRYPVIPKIGMSLAPILMALAVLPHIRAITRLNSVDLIDAHYFYPDGVAAALIGRWLGLPVLITARGTDINLIPRHSVPRRWILWAGRSCDAMISVCQALKEEMISIGLNEEKITALRNGVDLEFFRPVNLDVLHEESNILQRTILSVGYLVERKRHDLVISALPHLPQHRLVIVGTGPERERLSNLTKELLVSDRVHFAGHQSQGELVKLYSSADALVLMSNREGMANVLLESLACGTPVIARNVWGASEVVAEEVAGCLIDNVAPQAIAAAIRDVTSERPRARRDVRRYAERFDWYATSEGQRRVIQSVVERRRLNVPQLGR